jgi:diguanylate cyclase (GGDEF)-like protein
VVIATLCAVRANRRTVAYMDVLAVGGSLAIISLFAYIHVRWLRHTKVGNWAPSVVMTVMLVVSVITVSTNPESQVSIISTVGSMTLAVAAVLAARAGRQSSGPWRLLVAGSVAYVVGDILYALGDAFDSATIVTLSTLLYLSGGPVVGVGLVRGARQQGQDVRSIIYDAVIFSVAVASSGLMLTVDNPALDSLSGFEKAATVIYPLTTAGVLVIAVRLVLQRGQSAVLYRMITGGMIMVFTGDLLYMVFLATKPTGAALVVALTLSLIIETALCATTYAPLRQARNTKQRSDLASGAALSSFMFFAVSVAAVVVVAVVETARGRHISLWLLAGSVVAVVTLILARVGLLIKALNESQNQLIESATIDALTRIANRAWFKRQVEVDLDVMARDKTHAGAVMFCDLDNFKYVNDSLGHEAGDAVLVEVAARLHAAAPDYALVGRLSGDEFALWLPHARLDEIEQVAGKVVERLAAPINVMGKEIMFSGSIGVAEVGEGLDLVELLRRADLAMYYAKRSGKNRFETFDPSMQDLVAEQHMESTSALRHALERDEFVVHFQPVWTLPGGHIVGVEALVRWQPPDAPLRMPSTFLPMAEKRGLTGEIGAVVLRKALAALVELRHTHPALTMSVNVSASQLSAHGFVTSVDSLLKENDLPGDALVLELTETDVIRDFDHIRENVLKLRSHGVRIAIDDFGAGYSSLRYLIEFRPDLIKIDRSVIDALDGDDTIAALVGGVLSLASSAGADSVAEGVERSTQAAMLTESGCRFAQGWLHSQAVPFDELVEVLDATNRTTGGQQQPDTFAALTP